MKFGSFVFALFIAPSHGLKVRAGMWGPADLTAVETALEHVLSLHMTPAMHKRAQVVAADVKEDIMAISSGRNVTKSERQQKVGAAIKELGQFQQDMEKETDELVKAEKAGNMTAKMVALGNDLDPETLEKYNTKKAALEKKLAEKQAELSKDENMIKLIKLKKDLAEKQLELANLEMQKAKSASSKEGEAEDAKSQQEMVKNLLSVAKGLKAPSNKTVSKLPPAVDAILADLHKRSAALNATLAKIDETQRKSEAQIEDVLKKQVGAGKTDAITKAEAMIKSLKKKEDRKFQKLRVVKKSEMNEIDSAIASIQKGDVAGLQKVLGKMQAETKAVDAKSGHFLY